MTGNDVMSVIARDSLAIGFVKIKTIFYLKWVIFLSIIVALDLYLIEIVPVFRLSHSA